MRETHTYCIAWINTTFHARQTFSRIISDSSGAQFAVRKGKIGSKINLIFLVPS